MFPDRTNGLLCAAICVRLEYFRPQNSGYPLHGRVFVGTAAVSVDVAVAFPVNVVPFAGLSVAALLPTRRVYSSVVVVVILPVPVVVAVPLWDESESSLAVVTVITDEYVW